MIKFNKIYTYVGQDLNFRNMKCITRGMHEKGIKVTFSDEFLGNVEAYVKKKDLLTTN